MATNSTDPTDPIDSHEIDRLLRVLSDHRRRRILVRMLDAGPRAELDASPEALGLEAGSRDELEVSLVHRHLPKLASTGAIRWDRERGTVRRGPRFGSIEPLLCLLDGMGQASGRTDPGP